MSRYKRGVDVAVKTEVKQLNNDNDNINALFTFFLIFCGVMIY